MRRILTTVREMSDMAGELAALLGIVLVYWWVATFVALPGGNEAHLLEFARSILTHNQHELVPVSPLLAVFVGLVFKVFSATVVNARMFIVILSLFCVGMVYMLAGRLFQAGVGLLSAALIFASWGFFANTLAVNGAVLYVMLVASAFFLFYHWYDTALRSRTFAKGLYTHFILLGCVLGLAFCTYGVPGVLFPLGVMATTVLKGKRPEVITDVHYQWVFVPFGIIAVIWTTLGMLATGVLPFLAALFRFHPNLSYLLEPFVYLLPLLPLFIPALTSKDHWNRCFITHPNVVGFIGHWVAWSAAFLVFASDFHEAFSLAIVVPAILWLANYLNEIFRNPVFPKPLQLTLDGIIFLGFLGAIITLIFMFQLVPPELKLWFAIFSAVLPILSIAILLLKDMTISRALPFYLIPSALIICILLQLTYAPLFTMNSERTLTPVVSKYVANHPQTAVLAWQNSASAASPGLVRFMTPPQTAVTTVNTMDQLEAMIQTRRGSLLLILPENAFYYLPHSVRQTGYVLKTAYQWKKPLTAFTLFNALQNETLDFDALSTPVFLFEIPAYQED